MLAELSLAVPAPNLAGAGLTSAWTGPPAARCEDAQRFPKPSVAVGLRW